MARFGAVVAALVVAAAVFAASQADAAVTCSQVASNLRSCIPYVTGRVAELPSACCDGVRTLNSAARSTADRRATCNCIRSQASGINGIQTGRLSGIPSSCGVQVPYPISASTDCSRVT
ncbi:non-specific lipid-transfer protein 1-like [Zingiber officinale]|uniref:Bifunctional inhibitor/plant lipid transfer protein/seed storage helical domain-containing protein n=1 Tax=Zingiber officinale TaxID=94328 RepID=A0A8J5GAF4_ZINOF|nr:non-specific lipid-transfer protein 1-like [Zingiber officinale]XP_042397319.1 non-specific lipid-transfer protein 1-like [Zingiber officinale]KAG6504153.1 hypothetical protein ZIOFF_036484 [Zingiber officinale]